MSNGPEEERRHGTKPKPQKKIPQRKCVGCAERREKRELIRVVRLPDQGGVVLDDTGKKAGRGAYLCRNPACLKKALKARRLQNALDARFRRRCARR